MKNEKLTFVYLDMARTTFAVALFFLTAFAALSAGCGGNFDVGGSVTDEDAGTAESDSQSATAEASADGAGAVEASSNDAAHTEDTGIVHAEDAGAVDAVIVSDAGAGADSGSAAIDSGSAATDAADAAPLPIAAGNFASKTLSCKDTGASLVVPCEKSIKKVQLDLKWTFAATCTSPRNFSVSINGATYLYSISPQLNGNWLWTRITIPAQLAPVSGGYNVAVTLLSNIASCGTDDGYCGDGTGFVVLGAESTVRLYE